MNNAFFYIYETVDFPIQITAVDGSKDILKDCKNLIVSLGQGSLLLEKDLSSPDIGLDIDNNIINLHLSQTDTCRFKQGEVIIQVNILYEDTERDTSAQGKIDALNNLHRKIMV